MLSTLIQKYGDDFSWEATELAFFLQEVNRECGRAHPLYDRVRGVVARCNANDDVLFALEGGYAIVHLTYMDNNAVRFPAFKEFSDINAVLKHIEEQFVSEYI